jgi:hypothetical protein
LSEATGEQWPAPIERFLARLLEREASERMRSAAEVLNAWQELREQFCSSSPSAGILERGPLHLTFESWPEGDLDRTEVDGP